MSGVTKPNQQRKQRALTCTLTDEQFERIQTAAQSVGLTRSEWARQQLDRDSAPPAVPSPLGPEHVLLLLEQCITLRAFLEESIERSIPGAAPLTATALQELIQSVEEHRSAAAQSLLDSISVKPPLPFEKG